jgi:protein phosphatase
MTRVRAAAISETGPVRPINEDRYICDEDLGLFVVADGMGGHSAGEVASQLAVEAVEAFMRRSRDDRDFSWPYGVDPNLSFDANRLKTAVCLANRRVFRAAESRDEYTGMGTTIAAALVVGSRMTIGHAGDSRAYSFANGRLLQLTRDDSWVETLKALGQVPDSHTAADHAMRNVLTNVLGARDHAEVHILERTQAPGEWIVLCSDGVHGVLDEARMAAIIGEGDDPAAVARALVDAALASGGRDNTTAVLVRCLGE